MTKFLIKNTILPYNALSKISIEVMQNALEKTALEFIRWCNIGSSKTSAVPPIRYGFLRGSSSAFVGKKLVTVWNEEGGESGGNGEATPVENYNGKDLVLTIIYNTDYAKKVHEDPDLKFSELSLRAGAEKKFLEKHIYQDGQDLFDLVAKFMRSSL